MPTNTFVEIIRILQLAQESKEAWQRVERYTIWLLIMAESIFLLSLAVGMYFAKFRAIIFGIRNGVFTTLLAFLVLTTLFGLVRHCHQTMRSQKREFQAIREQVSQFLRETDSLIDKSNWSALEVFEFDLRLSILGISTKSQIHKGVKGASKSGFKV